jgi:hypothetical protein
MYGASKEWQLPSLVFDLQQSICIGSTTQGNVTCTVEQSAVRDPTIKEDQEII